MPISLQHPALHSVCHVGFEDLSAAGYDVEIFHDGAGWAEFEKTAVNGLPGNWNRKGRQAVIIPKIAKLRDATLLMDGSALLPDGRYCYFDISFSSERDEWIKEHSHRILCSIDPETDGAKVRSNMPSFEVSGRCFTTRINNPRNFGHFIHDGLSRIYYEDLGAIVPGRDKVIPPIMQTPMQEALFRKIFEGYEIVQAPHDAIFRVEELLILANLCSEQKFNPAAIEALARRMRRVVAAYAGKENHKICISRRDGRMHDSERDLGRDFANMEAYENLMRKLGYRVLKVSALDPEVQFALWANTTDIVGIHGAGMMNMIMMPSGGNYTEIAGASDHPNQTSPCPNWTIRCALAAGHRVRWILSEYDPQRNQPKIDIERLEAELSFEMD